MADTITVGSHAPAAFDITEALPADAKGKPRTVTINSARSAGAVGGVGVTRDVDAVMFHAWLDGQKQARTKLATKVFEMGGSEPVQPPVSPAQQPGADALVADAVDLAKGAESGVVPVADRAAVVAPAVTKV